MKVYGRRKTRDAGQTTDENGGNIGLLEPWEQAGSGKDFLTGGADKTQVLSSKWACSSADKQQQKRQQKDGSHFQVRVMT